MQNTIQKTTSTVSLYEAEIEREESDRVVKYSSKPKFLLDFVEYVDDLRFHEGCKFNINITELIVPVVEINPPLTERETKILRYCMGHETPHAFFSAVLREDGYWELPSPCVIKAGATSNEVLFIYYHEFVVDGDFIYL